MSDVPNMYIHIHLSLLYKSVHTSTVGTLVFYMFSQQFKSKAIDKDSAGLIKKKRRPQQSSPH